jgi:hypothetical protein
VAPKVLVSMTSAPAARYCPWISLVMIFEALAAEVGLGQLVALDHGAHRAVQDQDALAYSAREFGAAGVGGRGIGQLGVSHGGQSCFWPDSGPNSGMRRHG